MNINNFPNEHNIISNIPYTLYSQNKMNNLYSRSSIISNNNYMTPNEFERRENLIQNPNIILKENQILTSLNLEYGNIVKEQLRPDLDYNLNKYQNIPYDDLINLNYHGWINNLKDYFSCVLIHNFIQTHENNLNSINQLLSFTNIKLVTQIPEELNIHPISTFINQCLSEQNFMNNQNTMKNNCNKFNSNLNFGYDEPSYNSNPLQEKNMIKIFYGDTEKLKIITNEICQILDCPIQKENILNLTYNYQDRSRTFTESNTERLYLIEKHSTPFLYKQSFKYSELVHKSLFSYKDCLMNLCNLLYQRIILNDKIMPTKHIVPKNEKHSLVIIEYCLSRLRELKNNFKIYKNNCGGSFIGEKWSSLFPTDSQLISSFVVSLYEDVFINREYKQVFMQVFPCVPNNSELNKDQIVIYQKNSPDTEPYFYVVHKNHCIPCEKVDNFFHAFAMFLFYQRKKIRNLNDFNNTNLVSFYNYIFNGI